MVLLNDVVEVFALTHQAIDAGDSLDTFNGGCISATLVGSDLVWHIVQVDGTCRTSPGSSQVALGSQQKIHRIASAVNENTAFQHHLFVVTQPQRTRHQSTSRC